MLQSFWSGFFTRKDVCQQANIVGRKIAKISLNVTYNHNQSTNNWASEDVHIYVIVTLIVTFSLIKLKYNVNV